MPSPFDGIQSALFDTTTNVFGVEASWTPAGGGAAQQARVLFNDPTESRKFIMPNYDPVEPMMEFRIEHFIGLKQSVDSGNVETVIISTISYYVRMVTAHWDGKTYRAKLAPVNP